MREKKYSAKMIKKLNSFQLLKNVSGEKISLTNQRSKFFHMIKTKFFRIHAGKKKHGRRKCG